ELHEVRTQPLLPRVARALIGPAAAFGREPRGGGGEVARLAQLRAVSGLRLEHALRQAVRGEEDERIVEAVEGLTHPRGERVDEEPLPVPGAGDRDGKPKALARFAELALVPGHQQRGPLRRHADAGDPRRAAFGERRRAIGYRRRRKPHARRARVAGAELAFE